MNDIYDEATYNRFAENLHHALSGPNIRKVTLKQVRKPALRTGTQTKHGAWGWRSFVSSRIGPRTVYLGPPDVLMSNPTKVHRDIIANAPEQLHKTLQLCSTLPMIHLRRQMGSNDLYNPICNLYLSVANPINYRLALMWGTTMNDVDKRKPGPEFIMIHIPEEDRLRQQVLHLPAHHINICLGSDYMGEDKKGFLRQSMWSADKEGMLGLHAGDKMCTIRDPKDGKLKKYGVLLFGLSATGKSTWSCHRLGLDEEKGEGTEVIQDDICFMRSDGSAYGSEANFFVKTDVDEKLQEAMYSALTDKTAMYENVMINSKGEPDFLDETICGNGRAVIRKDKLRIRLGKKRKPVAIDYPGLNLPPLDELDGIILAFITRRNTFMPFAQELTAEQAVLAYLWGESSHSYASEPDKAGESVRTVGTDPFIVGSRGKKVNHFRNIIMTLNDKFPGKIRFFQYNTGGVGEIIEKTETPEGLHKRLLQKVVRVPIPVMAAIQRGDLHGINKYEKGALGTSEIVQIEGFDLSKYDPKRFYDPEQIEAYIASLVIGRRKFTDEINEEGLDPEIMRWAEKSFEISRQESGRLWAVDVPTESTILGPRPRALAVAGNDGGSLLERPSRSFGWRMR